MIYRNNIVRFSQSKGIYCARLGMSSLSLYSYCYRDVSQNFPISESPLSHRKQDYSVFVPC